VERAKIGEKQLSDLKKCTLLLRILVNVNRNGAIQGKRIEIATFLPVAAG
jgi:hypothetical protein